MLIFSPSLLASRTVKIDGVERDDENPNGDKIKATFVWNDDGNVFETQKGELARCSNYVQSALSQAAKLSCSTWCTRLKTASSRWSVHVFLSAAPFPHFAWQSITDPKMNNMSMKRIFVKA